MSKRILTLDLHPIRHQGSAIDTALYQVIQEAQERKAKKVEIIPGKGTGQLKKRVMKFLDRKDVKRQYDRLQVDAKNHGRVYVYFKH